MKTCCLCHRTMRETQDCVRLYSYPFVIEGRGYAHWLCFRIRIAAMRAFQDQLERNTKYIPNDVPLFGLGTETARGHNYKNNQDSEVADAMEYKCGYCTRTIDQDEDMAVFNHRCKHKTVHLTCLSFVDFTRKEGCPYCYSDDVRRYRIDWADDTGGVSAPDTGAATRLNHSYITMTTNYAVDNGQRADPELAKLKGDHITITSSIIRSLLLQGTPAVVIKSEYDKNKAYMAEPIYPTAMRKLMLELNMDGLGRHVISGHNQFLPVYSKIYTVQDMIKMGLTVPMIVYNRNEFLMFSANYLSASKLTKDFLGPDFFISILLAGITVKWFVLEGIARSCDDLYLIDFNMNAFWAAGGVPLFLQGFMTAVAANTFKTGNTDFLSLLPNFGATQESIKFFFD